MLDAWILGAAAGMTVGASAQWQQRFGGAKPEEPPDADTAPDSDGTGQESSPDQQPGGSRQRRRHPILKVLWPALLLAAGTGVLAARSSIWWRRRSRNSTPAQTRIPLKELVRFREKQWFVEELENAHEGDPNAMLRLAKMYLYGQGCQRSVNIAQEWLRRARALGVPCTLEELLTAEDLEQMQQAMRAKQVRQQRQNTVPLGAMLLAAVTSRPAVHR